MRLGFGKSHHHEFDARVPFLARGPGVPANSTPSFLTGNVDLAPTLLELAGVKKEASLRSQAAAWAEGR